MSSTSTLQVNRLSHHYGERRALQEVSFQLRPQEIFVILGPNGSGKSTLFRILCTLMKHQSGDVSILGHRLPRDIWKVRQRIGVVFQSPSLDKKLTVEENLRHQGALYGMAGHELARRAGALMRSMGLVDRRHDRAETLSGGLRRRVDLAKGLLHQPRLLLMDEPSTGLDPGARGELWRYLRMLNEDLGVTILLTTHLLDEAEKADRIAILNHGRIVALDSPEALRTSVSGDCVTIESDDPKELAGDINARFSCNAKVIDNVVRFEVTEGHRWITRVIEAFPGRIDTITLGRPTLEDVFIDRTGHRFRAERAEVLRG